MNDWDDEMMELHNENPTAFEAWTHVGSKDLVVPDIKSSNNIGMWIAASLGLLLGAALLPWMINLMIPLAMRSFGTVVIGTGAFHASYAQGGFAAFLQKMASWLSWFRLFC
jgi:hypothetical protein